MVTEFEIHPGYTLKKVTFTRHEPSWFLKKKSFDIAWKEFERHGWYFDIILEGEDKKALERAKAYVSTIEAME